jgi:4-hydroxy-tetrahydrodipicolinate synthase
MKLEGCFTAMVTPFRQDKSLDLEGLRNNVRFQIENGVSGLVPLGTTGESPTVTEEERVAVIKTVVDEVNGKVPVIVGTGSNSTEKTIKETRQAKELGADAALIVSPYYNKPSQEGLYHHFESVAEAVDIPIVVYNIKGRTGVNIETKTLKRIAEFRNITAVKEASGDINQMQDVLRSIPDFTVLSGDDGMTYNLMALGGKGVISVVSNLMPAKVSELCELMLDGNSEAGEKLHKELMPIFEGAFVETNPVPIKVAMNLKGLAAGPVRQPLWDLMPESKEKLVHVLKEMHIV